MSTSRTHITLPDEVRADLDRLVEKRNRSRFIAEAVRKALLIARQKQAHRLSPGAWKDHDHADLEAEVGAWEAPFGSRCQHCRGVHRVRLAPRAGETQRFPNAGASALSTLPESYVAKRIGFCRPF